MAVQLKLCFSLVWCWLTLCTASRSPIVIVPGIMGSQMEARLSKDKSLHSYCKLQSDWYHLWFAYRDISLFSQKCFAENIKLHFNRSTGEYRNTQGVETRVPGFGNTSCVENLDPTAPFLSKTSYFDLLVDHFVELGYERGKSIRAAPYDWRLAVVELTAQGYFKQLQELIEDTYNRNGKAQVTLLSHSMGSIVTHYFLTHSVSQQWKETFIDQFISLAGVWLGAAKMLKAIVSGDTDGMFILAKGLQMRPDERSFPSDYWLLPIPSMVWDKDTLLLSTPSSNYSAHNISSLLSALNYTDSNLMYMGVLKEIKQSFPPPNVTTVCMYGSNIKTEESYTYTGTGTHQFPDGDPIISWGDGDGTVNLRSLEACQLWQGQQHHPVKTMMWPGAEHFKFARDQRVLEYLSKLIRVK